MWNSRKAKQISNEGAKKVGWQNAKKLARTTKPTLKFIKSLCPKCRRKVIRYNIRNKMESQDSYYKEMLCIDCYEKYKDLKDGLR